MAATYRKVNYSLRPAKQIERRMLAEAFQRLAEFGALSSYRYVGFGSIYFRDFILFHRALGLTNMLSIEQDGSNQARFEFNLPFSCVAMRFDEAQKVLPSLPWDIRTILWLDYEDRLSAAHLGDVTKFCAAATAGSVLLVTVLAEADQPESFGLAEQAPDVGAEGLVTPPAKSSLQVLKERVGEMKVPVDIAAKDLAGWGSATVARRILRNHVMEQLEKRNGGRPQGARYKFKELFNFEYRDGTRMTTFGGVLYDEGQATIVAKCDFDSLEFVRSTGTAYRIEVPALTYRELRDLDRRLPGMPDADRETHPVPKSDIDKYARIYRFFPMFAEIDA